MSGERLYIAVVGAGECEAGIAAVAEEVGRLLAKSSVILLSGGLGGVMAAASRGAKAEGGLTVGLLPTATRVGANTYLDVAIPTGLGEVRNALVVRAADAVIAIAGEFGTLSEIALALKMGKPVVGLDTWELVKQGKASASIHRVATAEQAVISALKLAQKGD